VLLLLTLLLLLLLTLLLLPLENGSHAGGSCCGFDRTSRVLRWCVKAQAGKGVWWI